VGEWRSTHAQAVMGIPRKVGPNRFTPVRKDNLTREAPPATMSVAISDPELPMPTTRTSRRRYGCDDRYATEWISSPS
jgi:hypothetical protein